jgi:hypothetical protein
MKSWLCLELFLEVISEKCTNNIYFYFLIRIDTYRYFSSLLGSNIWQISKNGLLEFVNLSPGLISDSYNFNDVLLQQTSITNALIDKEERTKNKNKNLPDNIVRHQFMSLLVKMAKDKYMSRSKILI